jgi:hypothetical protein
MDKDKPPSRNKKIAEITVFVSNLSEDVWPFIRNMSDSKERANEIEENAYLADSHLFSLAEESRVILITPKSISNKLLKYFKNLFNIKNAEILVPSSHSGEICKDIMKDKKILNKLFKLANSSKKLTLVPYSTSLQFINLLEFLNKKGIATYTPESPLEEDAWTVNFFGSKSGIRQLSQQASGEEPDLIMPDGYICMGIEDAARIAAKKYIKEGGVVIKTNKGHSGAGVLIFRPNELSKMYSKTEKEILKILRKNSYWEKFPIIIESLININPKIAGGFPNVEFKIQKNGKIEFLYFGGMRITKEGVFKGMEVNDDVISDRLETQMMDTGFFVGEKYSQMGYRGYYDVDFVISRGGKLYVTESNVRRTGGTHIFHIASKLIGDDFLYDTYILSYNLYPLPEGKKYDFEKICKTLSPILYNKKTKEGIIIVSENLLKMGKLTYVIFGNSKKRALKIENQMETLLNS